MNQIVFLFIIGSIIGSFLNVCIYRLPEKVSLVFPSSYCPKCKSKIPIWSNIPIIGFLILKGKCNNCSSNISFRYPLVELLSSILTILSFLTFGFSIQFFVYSVLIYFLIVIAFIDLKTHLIYDKVLLTFFIIGLLIQLIFPFIAWEESLLGVLLGGLSMFLISLLGKWMFNKESMGMGDVKLVAVAGFFVGWINVLISVYLGFIIAFIIMMILIRLKKRETSDLIPFGPFIAMGIILFLFVGEEIIQFYLSLVY